MGSQADEAARLRQMFLDVLDGMEVAEGSEGGERFSIDPNFARIIDSLDFEDETQKHFWIRVGTTSEVLQKLGVDDRKIFWHSGKIAKILEDHQEMTKEIIKQVPQLLENPIVVMESKTVEGRITMLGEVYGEDGRPVLAVLELNPTSADRKTFINRLVVVNAFTRGEGIVEDVEKRNHKLQNIITTSKILYVDPNAKRTRNWLTATGLQLPPQSSSYGFFGSIKPQKLQKVNTSGESYSLPMGEQMDKLRLSLGLETQNSRLTQKIEDYQQIVRQQDAEIRELQRELSRAGVRVFADAGFYFCPRFRKSNIFLRSAGHFSAVGL